MLKQMLFIKVDWSGVWAIQEALCESEATATNVLSVRKRSDSNNKAPSRNGNQPHVMKMNNYNSLDYKFLGYFINNKQKNI
ncbi:hypothetical protein [Lysinibacillus sp. JNUCC 51]|uniref:hypothetical protein n=1 Tax=Lysinibacillus sp. JNUCC-51 TaxID=2792479 RepID=UPI001936512A|nr:hypothetical protein JNUCC51_17680 [Lysinibacillus sp. JNUCC-51]